MRWKTDIELPYFNTVSPTTMLRVMQSRHLEMVMMVLTQLEERHTVQCNTEYGRRLLPISGPASVCTRVPFTVWSSCSVTPDSGCYNLNQLVAHQSSLCASADWL
jgi:hypothetical protein